MGHNTHDGKGVAIDPQRLTHGIPAVIDLFRYCPTTQTFFRPVMSVY